jgi:hypothetical protein
MANGELEKMRIIAYNNPDLADSHQVGDPFYAMMNPEVYTLDYKVEFAGQQAQGTSGGHQSFTMKPPEEMAFDFLFDNTGIIDGKPTDNIAEKVLKFKELLIGIDSSSHEPKHFKLGWGTFLFKGRCKGLNIAYKLFKSDGKALRAICKATFTGSIEESLRIAEDNLHSPDLTHYRLIKKGDTLPLMCYRIYGNTRYYMEIARVNKLSNFRKLNPGDELFFPPLDKISAK